MNVLGLIPLVLLLIGMVLATLGGGDETKRRMYYTGAGFIVFAFVTLIVLSEDM